MSEDILDHMDGRKSPWMRGLQMLILLFLFGLAEAVLLACAVVQFGWLVITGDRNARLAAFGSQLGRWLAKTARFQTCASDEKPFPWTAWQ